MDFIACLIAIWETGGTIFERKGGSMIWTFSRVFFSQERERERERLGTFREEDFEISTSTEIRKFGN